MTEPDEVSHALLLRLFQSEFFSPHLALSYLKTYSDSIGITYCLVEQLRTAFDDTQVELYWPQLCHLLITKPSKSRALEYFVVQRCNESVHIALIVSFSLEDLVMFYTADDEMKTLWFFQAALYDLSNNPHLDSFQICQRVFNQCQRILYDDPLAETDPIASSYSGSSSTLDSNFRRRLRIKAKSLKGEKVLPSNALPCLVGMGVVLAGAPGLPSMAPMCGVMAIEQGRRKPQGRDRQPLEGSGMQMMRNGEDENNSDDEINTNGRGILDDEDEDDDANDEDDEDEDEGEGEGRRDANGKVASNGGRQQKGKEERREGRRGKRHGGLRNFRDLSISTNTSPSIFQTEFSKRTASLDHAANPLAQITTGFTELKDKATAAVNDVFGQMAVDFAPGTRTKSQNKATPLWHAQSKRMKSPQNQRLSNEYRGHRVNASVPNLINSARNSTSSSPFASSVTLAEDGQSLSAEAILARYDTEARRRLLRSNYCRKQTSFLQTLQDISARLLILPKPARLSALRAELTELNHTLPAEVCFPMWCGAEMRDGQENSDANKSPSRKSKGKSGRHHRVVRINPSEAVVLNSADRVPYLLHVEVLVDDLDFDTERRQNRESLKKLMMQEEIRRRKTAISRQLTGSGQLLRGSRSDVDVTETIDKSETSLVVPDASSLTPSLPSHDQAGSPLIVSPNEDGRFEARQASPNPTEGMPRPVDVGEEEEGKEEEEGGEREGEEEEIDLTEQAYGHDLSGFGEEKDEESSDEEDLARMNVMHDNAAWSQAQLQRSNAQSNGLTSPISKSASHRRQASIGTNHTIPASKKKDFSLDEYAERMRTAAIMLAQLNQSTNASAHPIVASNPHVSSTAQGGWSSWVIGTSWATTKAQPGKKSEAGQGSAGVNAPLSVAAAGGGQSSSTLATGMPLGNRSVSSSSRLVHTGTESIRKRIMQEMMALEEERMERMKVSSSNHRKNRRGTINTGLEDEMTIQRAVNKDDPSAAMFRESWSTKKARIRASSPYGHFDNWNVFSVIVKTGADLRQEQLAVQLIQEFGRIWQETGSRCWIRYFKILVTSENSGIMETITDAVSVHSIKKEAYSRHQSSDGKIATYSLLDHFINSFGDSSSKFNKARQNFMESLAAYSIISYLLHLKDRHNGNLLIDQDGHLIHIDFGYMLGISPGGVGFEAAPFKMPQEYLDILGGLDSPKFAEFKTLVCQGFRDVRKHAERIIMMVELMQKDSKLPCFALGEMTSNYLRDRFQLALSHSQCDEFVDRLIMNSLNSTFTRLYDQYQYYSEGILS